MELVSAMHVSARTIICCLLASLLVGCAAIGPRSIRAGRAAYAEAINQTQDQQILLSIVKGRYGESTTLLAVNSVVANLRFQAEAGIEAGFRGAGEPGEDLLIGGIAYEENPTITYTPVEGEGYTKQLMSPLPLDFLLLILRSTILRSRALVLLVNRINDLRNPGFLQGPASRPDPRFMRLVELLSKLGDAGALDLVQSDEKGVAFNVWLDPLTRKDAANIAEVLDLLGLPKKDDDGKALIIPVYFGIRADKGWKIGITTRSTFRLIEILRAAVEVPEAHAAAGLAVTYPPLGLVGRGIRIHSSSRRPEGQSLAVKYRGYWFWIDETDLDTKDVFRLTRTLWSTSMADAAKRVTAPVLTLPVGH